MTNEQDGKSRSFAETPWFRYLGAISVITAVPALILGLPPVQEKIFDRDPRIQVDLSSELPVFDIRKPMRGLSIVLNGSDINASNESLIASRVIIRNAGKISVKPNDVSIEDPIGFEIIGGEIIELTGFRGSNTHLQKLTKPKITQNRVTISNNIIIDSKDYMQFDFLIKKGRGKKIIYRSIGKIANSPSIIVIDQRDQSQKQNFLELAFLGSPLVQISRIIAYFFVGIFILAGIVFVFEKIQNYFELNRKKSQKIIISNFLSNSENRNRVADAVAAAMYYCLSKNRFKFLVEEKTKLKISSSIGKITNNSISFHTEREPIEPTFDSIVKFLDEKSYAAELWHKQIERKFNLINFEGTEIQQAYATSLESMLALANAVDPKGKLSTKAREYYTSDEVDKLEIQAATKA